MFVTGCNNISEEEMMEGLVSRHPDFYMLYAVPEKEKNFKDNLELQDYYNVDFNRLISPESLDTLYYGSFIWLNDVEKYEYVESLELDEFPTFLVFDSKMLVFKSTEIEEVDEYLSTREETNLIKKRRENRLLIIDALEKTEKTLRGINGIETTASSFDGGKVNFRLMIRQDLSKEEAIPLFNKILESIDQSSNELDIWQHYVGNFDIKSFEKGVIYEATKLIGGDLVVKQK
ncbi:hypothetical protein GCM10008967_28050 [Bacillus carboniphilus]|uniref:Lipoprotein n=1 Tax=Bacillus carboniphilus TaxID=86663 RepID=A0ABP3G4V9_9BACI